MTPSSAYLPGTPGGQPMTPGSGGLDMMSPVVGLLLYLSFIVNCYIFHTMFLLLYIMLSQFMEVLYSGGDGEGPWFLPDILVNVRRPGDDTSPGVIREMLPVYIL